MDRSFFIIIYHSQDKLLEMMRDDDGMDPEFNLSEIKSGEGRWV